MLTCSMHACKPLIHAYDSMTPVSYVYIIDNSKFLKEVTARDLQQTPRRTSRRVRQTNVDQNNQGIIYMQFVHA